MHFVCVKILRPFRFQIVFLELKTLLLPCCESLTSIHIPKSVSSIGVQAF